MLWLLRKVLVGHEVLPSRAANWLDFKCIFRLLKQLLRPASIPCRQPDIPSIAMEGREREEEEVEEEKEEEEEEEEGEEGKEEEKRRERERRRRRRK